MLPGKPNRNTNYFHLILLNPNNHIYFHDTLKDVLLPNILSYSEILSNWFEMKKAKPLSIYTYYDNVIQ